MPLFVAVNPQETQVGLDLAHIVGADNGHIGTPGTGGTQDQVTYTETIPNFVDDRMNAIINNTPSFPIVITGVTNTFVLPDGTPITSAAGVTSVPPGSINPAGTGVNPNTTISVIYDVTGCGGSGYCVFDRNGHSTSEPTEVILFHELAHAFHWANNDFDKANPEPQAENDENKLRDQEGIAERDPNNHSGGCGTCPSTSKCFIVSAAFGSPQAPEVEALRQLRDKLLRQSMLGDEFFLYLHAEYYSFSPLVAVDMNALPVFRAMIVDLLVEPFLTFLRLAERYVLHGGWREPDFANKVIRSLRSSLLQLTEAGSGRWRAEEVCTLLAQLRTGRGSDRPEARIRDRLASFSASSISSVFSYLDNVVHIGDSPSTYVDWAILRPLMLYWTMLSRLGAEDSEETNIGLEFAQAIEDWLVEIPIPPSLDYSTEEAIRNDLAILTQTAFAVPSIRRRFGMRLLAVLGGSVSYDLGAILQSTDYLLVHS